MRPQNRFIRCISLNHEFIKQKNQILSINSDFSNFRISLYTACSYWIVTQILGSLSLSLSLSLSIEFRANNEEYLLAVQPQ
ncbi:hypothetical protein ACSBR2_035099 [Camellia fascicularis]